MRKKTTKAGLPPGTVLYTGDQSGGPVRITVADYDEQQYEEKEFESLSQCVTYRGKPTVTWIDIRGVHQTEIVEEIGRCFGIHPLVLEDIANTRQRTKLEEYDDFLFLVLRVLSTDEKTGSVREHQTSLVFSDDFLISFHDTDIERFRPLRDRLRAGKGRVRRGGTSYLAYSLIDQIVDSYFGILESVGERIEAIEQEVVASPRPRVLKTIHEIKRDMLVIRRAIWPLREAISRLLRAAGVSDDTKIYLRDVYDHAVQIIDTVETHRETVAGLFDIYLSSVSYRMNEVMKTLTIIATIFIPLTFIVGVYGMNFRHMPELEWPWAYPALWGFMVLVVIGMFVFFRRRKWL